MKRKKKSERKNYKRKKNKRKHVKSRKKKKKKELIKEKKKKDIASQTEWYKKKEIGQRLFCFLINVHWRYKITKIVILNSKLCC